MQRDEPTHKSLWELIKDIRFGMFTHRDAHGVLHAHPLTTLNKSVDENATLYFFVKSDSEIVSAVGNEQQVCVTYSDPSSDSYVSVSGEAHIDNDQAKKEELFTSMWKAWYPAGPTDPSLTLLTVRLRQAEYWETDDGKMVQLFKIAKAAITGDTPPDLGDHKEMRL
jgi:general stress protein 26